jgi:hypothetical protein
MTVQLLTLDEYNSIAARMLNKRLGKSYVTYDNIGLVTHYLIRADIAYVPGITAYQGKPATLKTFRGAWFKKIEKRIKFGKSKSKYHIIPDISIDDIFDKDEYNYRRDTFCVQNYVSEIEYKAKFKELETLIDSHFSKLRSKKKSWKGTRYGSPTHMCVKMFYIQGKSYKEIAEEFNITAGAVQHRVKTHSKNIDWDSLK